MGKQTFVALRCFECLKFSVQLQKKSGKWACAACGARQSALRCFAVSDVASDVRGVVARLNALHGALTDDDAAAAALAGGSDDGGGDGAPSCSAGPAAAAAANHGGGGGGGVKWDAFVDGQGGGWGEDGEGEGQDGGGGSDGDGGEVAAGGRAFVTALPAQPRRAAAGLGRGSGGGGGGGGGSKRANTTSSAVPAAMHYKRARPPHAEQGDARIGSGDGRDGWGAPLQAPQPGGRPMPASGAACSAPAPRPVPNSFRLQPPPPPPPQQQQQQQQQPYHHHPQQQQRHHHHHHHHHPQQHHHHRHHHPQQQQQQRQAGATAGNKQRQPSAWDAFVGDDEREAAGSDGSGDENEGAAVARAWGTEW